MTLHDLAFLGTGSALGLLMAERDWSDSPLGPPAGWSPSLKTTVGLMLPASAQIVLFWGEKYCALYNDAYAPTIGDKHPRALGRPASEGWAELWDDLGPLLDSVRETRATFEARDRQFYIERHGYPEDVWFDVSYSAVLDADGSVGGVLCIVNETTQRVLAERRHKTLLALADRLAQTADAQAAKRAAVALLGETLGAARVGYAEVSTDDQNLAVASDWTTPGMSSLGGESRPLESFGPKIIAALRAGETLRLDSLADDMRAAPHADGYASIGVRAMIGVPLVRAGRLTALLYIHEAQPRRWTEHDIALAQAVAARTWDAVERARAEQALHALNATLEARVAERTAALEEAQEALRQSQKLEAMGQLTGGVAHDFNNLLTPIFASLDRLKRQGLGGEREQRLIDGALASAERARDLLQRLLAFARRQPLQPSAVDLASLIANMGALLESVTGPQIRIVTDVEENLACAHGDRNQLEMALLNLAVNARDAMPDGGTLRLSARSASQDQPQPAGLPANAYVRVSVSDTGHGMDEATRARAIEPFFSTKGIGKGTGLGLSMVHGLAAQLGGVLTIASAPGAGSTFELWLPVSRQALALTHAPSVKPAKHAGVALLVDDEPLVRASSADQLTELGYMVIEAGEAEAALALLDDGLCPDVIVTDHLMPGMSGAEFCRRVRARWPGRAVLITSGYADVEDLAPDLPRLVKPFRHEDLASAVAAVRRLEAMS
ncbi:ATP-binding protein [Caulobacter sp. CCNWLY153]|uniref:hybrid sensor histidine kinase/response regulator n=1 Tax=unclassified Caulobacter TaxID=2648921 RepID=UPI002FF0C0D1